MLPVAVDAMGGDHAPDAIVAGAVRAAKAGSPVVLLGDGARLRSLVDDELRRSFRRTLPLTIEHCADAVRMDESPAAVRKRPDSSMRRSLALVREGRACAAVSCGNSGSLLVSSVLELGTLDGADRPAIATLLPRQDGGRLVLLDAGANVDCRPELLASFAQLGVAYAETLGVADPRVGLLSNGEEDAKGNVQVRATLPLLRSLDLTFVGNVEPSAAMAGACDVLVCDGFVGNVLLKAAEGAVGTVVALLKQEIRRRPSGIVGAFLLRGAFRRFRERVAWDATGGALLLGTSGVVVVGHGRANAEAVHRAVEAAARHAELGLVPAMRRRLAFR